MLPKPETARKGEPHSLRDLAGHASIRGLVLAVDKVRAEASTFGIDLSREQGRKLVEAALTAYYDGLTLGLNERTR